MRAENEGKLASAIHCVAAIILSMELNAKQKLQVECHVGFVRLEASLLLMDKACSDFCWQNSENMP